MALAVDGSATGSVTGAASVSATLTTSSANDIIIAAVRTNDGNSPNAPRTSSISGGGLTWINIKSVVFDLTSNTSGGEISLWYAVASGALTSQSLTANFSGSTGGTASRINVFGISGGDTSTPLDTDASLPGFNSGDNLTSIANSSAVSTNNANDMLVGFIGGQNGFGTITRPSGFSQVIATGTAQDISTNIVAATQSSQTFTWSWNGGANDSAMIITAIRAAGGGGGASVTYPQLERNIRGLNRGLAITRKGGVTPMRRPILQHPGLVDRFGAPLRRAA